MSSLWTKCNFENVFDAHFKWAHDCGWCEHIYHAKSGFMLQRSHAISGQGIVNSFSCFLFLPEKEGHNTYGVQSIHPEVQLYPQTLYLSLISQRSLIAIWIREKKNYFQVCSEWEKKKLVFYSNLQCE